MAEIRRNLDMEFAQRRDRALRDAEHRKKEAMDKIPELASLDAKITLAGIRYIRSMLSENGSDSDAEALSQHIDMLNKRKEELLVAYGFPGDYLEPRFTCPLCEDRGYITTGSGQVTCSCYQKLYLEKLYAFSNILDDGETGFEFFDESYFSDKADKKKYKSDVSPRAQINSIKEKCLEFIDAFDKKDTKNMYFFGPTGTGKTFMAKSIGLELLKKGYTVLYLSAPSLFSIIRRHRLNLEHNGASADESYRNLITANLLILDDLGIEPASDARYAELLTLLELRKAQDKASTAKTVISSNLDIKRLFQEYNERIASRIVGEFNTLQFIGDDIRIIKKIAR